MASTIDRAREPGARDLVGRLRCCVGPDDIVIYLGQVTYRGDFVRLEMDLTP